MLGQKAVVKRGRYMGVINFGKWTEYPNFSRCGLCRVDGRARADVRTWTHTRTHTDHAGTWSRTYADTHSHWCTHMHERRHDLGAHIDTLGRGRTLLCTRPTMNAHGTRLYRDQYAVAVLNPDGSEDGRVVGWVLAHPDPRVFEEKLRDYDRIEGFDSEARQHAFRTHVQRACILYGDGCLAAQNPDRSFYKRAITCALLEEELRAENGGQQIGAPGQQVEVYMYCRLDYCTARHAIELWCFRYHRTDADLSVAVPEGDWLKRTN